MNHVTTTEQEVPGQRAGTGPAPRGPGGRRALSGAVGRAVQPLVPVVQIALSFIVLIAVWWILARTVASDVLPHPADVLNGVVALSGDGSLSQGMWETLPSLFIGLFVACGVGAVLGVLMGVLRPLDKIAGPWLYVAWSTPIVAGLPLIVLNFGIGTTAVTIYVFLSSVFPVIMNARSGAKHVDKQMIEVARSLGARRFEIVKGVVLPSSVPSIVAGVRVAVGRAVVGVIIAQLFISAAGIGRMLQLYGELLQLDLYFASLLSIILIGVALNGLADLGERRIVRWHAR